MADVIDLALLRDYYVAKFAGRPGEIQAADHPSLKGMDLVVLGIMICSATKVDHPSGIEPASTGVKAQPGCQQPIR